MDITAMAAAHTAVDVLMMERENSEVLYVGVLQIGGMACRMLGQDGSNRSQAAHCQECGYKRVYLTNQGKVILLLRWLIRI